MGCNVKVLTIFPTMAILAMRKQGLVTNEQWENMSNDTIPRLEPSDHNHLALDSDKRGQNYTQPPWNIIDWSYDSVKLPEPAGQYPSDHLTESNRTEESLLQRLRTSRIFSIFSLVRFKNEECTPSGTQNTYIGTCYLSTECAERVSCKNVYPLLKP